MKPISTATAVASVWILIAAPALKAGAAAKEHLHPRILLLDKDGNKVIESGNPVSTRKTCGKCHDYDFISKGFHFQQGRLQFSADHVKKSGLSPSFNSSPGMFGKYCAMPNRQIPPLDVKSIEDFEMGVPEWVRSCGVCHPGGGVAETDDKGRRMDTVDPSTTKKFDIYYHWVDPMKGELLEWDWRESGVVEIDCFMCHSDKINREMRDEYIREGYFDEVVNASLTGTGIVIEDEDSGELVYNKSMFDKQGFLKEGVLEPKKPGVNNCGKCHGFAVFGDKIRHIDPFYGAHDVKRGTKKMGRIWAPGKIAEFDVHYAKTVKHKHDFPWDIHAAKGLTCVDCHYSLNNPEHMKTEGKKPHLRYSPPPLTYKEHLRKPDHNFAKGHTIPETVRDDLDYSMRGCTSCHDPTANGLHSWLPYAEHHFKRLECETCHIPEKHFWAYQQVDITASDRPIAKARGVKGYFHDPNAEVTCFEPLYMTKREKNGLEKILPVNTVSALLWIDEERGGRPAFQRELTKALFTRDKNYQKIYKPEVIKAFDKNNDGKLSRDELKLDTKEKYELVESLMKKAGLKEPKLELQVVPFGLNHNVVNGKHALRDCTECHSPSSRLLAPKEVYSYVPPVEDYNFMCELCKSDHEVDDKSILAYQNGKIMYKSAALLNGFYIIGATHVALVEIIGWLSVFGALCFAIGHGGLRILYSRRRKK